MLLRDILSEQDAIETRQTSFEHKLIKLEEVATRTPTSSDSSPSNKRRRLVLRLQLVYNMYI